LKICAPYLLLAAAAFAQPQFPPTPKKAVVDVYHGVRVTDNYRWLEDFSDPAVKQWANAQNRFARTFLDALPQRTAILQQLVEWDSRRKPIYWGFTAHGTLFAMKSDPTKQHPVLVALGSLDDPSSERVIVDPDRIDPTHGTAIDFYSPSLDGRYVAVSLSTGGSETGDVHVYETATGAPLTDVIPRVNGGTAGGSVAWSGWGKTKGFYYTRYPRGTERPPADLNFYQQVYFHRLGEPTEIDTYVLGKDFPRIAEIVLQTSPDGRYVAATVANGDGGDFEHWVLRPEIDWRKVVRYADGVKALAFGYHDDIYLLSKQGAPRGQVLRIGVNQDLTQAKVVVPQSDVVIEGLVPARAGLAVSDMAGGPSQLRFFPETGGAAVNIPIPPVSAVQGVARLDDDSLLFNVSGYITPPEWRRFDPKSGQTSSTALRYVPPFSTDGYEVIRDMAISKDGTKIPINIIRRKGLVLDGSHPAQLTGYGGFDISTSPEFSPDNFILLERGFVVAEANIRGGGEFGEEWHEQGMLNRKQNVFDDFAACARYLIDHHYTQPAKLGIIGGSNGGLLMGAELTQHPELFRAVVSEVGIYDMLRLELSPNGAFNVTEYGTVKEMDQFRALYNYSPYHHVKDGVQYPAVLFMTGDNDPRVDPMNSRKMTARLQASGTKQPVLLRTSGNSGHGFGTAKNEAFAQAADAAAFIIEECAGR
jgi:prolyl oligopeptidase